MLIALYNKLFEASGPDALLADHWECLELLQDAACYEIPEIRAIMNNLITCFRESELTGRKVTTEELMPYYMAQKEVIFNTVAQLHPNLKK